MLRIKEQETHLILHEHNDDDVEKICLSDKNNGYFTWRPMCVYDNTSLTSSSNRKYFRQNCRKNQDKHFMCKKIFPNKT